MHGSLSYRDQRLSGYDAAAVVEVIEHLDEPRLAAFERVLFEFARPGTVIVTTPNVEYNVKFETLPAGHFRHRDHRFEWTREQFRKWASEVAKSIWLSGSIRFDWGGRPDCGIADADGGIHAMTLDYAHPPSRRRSLGKKILIGLAAFPLIYLLSYCVFESAWSYATYNQEAGTSM